MEQRPSGTPFRRALNMMGLLAALTSVGAGAAAALQAVGPYVSRGKGRGKYSGKGHGNKAGIYMPHQGSAEKSRRVRQMALGII